MERFVSQNTPEWHSIWEALSCATGDYADECPDTGERWQYMGTAGGRHTFRHRHRPQFLNGKAIQPIKGFAGLHCDRVYVDVDEDTLRVVSVRVFPYLETAAKV